jgi:RimJ/RimL family protein N-acetyltransferase
MLESDRLLLRPFHAGDLAPLLAMQARPEVVRWLYHEPRDEAQARELLDRKIASTGFQDGHDSIDFAVVLKDTGEVVGDVNLHLVSAEHRQGEIGFVFHPDHQGRGYATEAARLLLDLAFREYRLHRVVGRLESRNTASARVLERLGMRREADLVENEWVKGEWQSETVYAVLDHEWLAEAPPPAEAAGG